MPSYAVDLSSVTTFGHRCKQEA